MGLAVIWGEIVNSQDSGTLLYVEKEEEEYPIKKTKEEEEYKWRSDK